MSVSLTAAVDRHLRFVARQLRIALYEVLLALRGCGSDDVVLTAIAQLDASYQLQMQVPEMHVQQAPSAAAVLNV